MTPRGGRVGERAYERPIADHAQHIDLGDDALGVCYLINYRYDDPRGSAGTPCPIDAPKYTGEYHDRS